MSQDNEVRAAGRVSERAIRHEAPLQSTPIREGTDDLPLLTALHRRKRIVLAIPGGPGLGGQYLEPFLLELAISTGMNVALMDLPNHGESIIRENDSPLNYPRSLALLESAVGQIAKETGDIVLFGQSFGARLAWDLLSASGVKFSAAILMGFPYIFENSNEFEKGLAGVALEDYRGDPDDETVFVRNWRKILPFYTPKPLPTEAVEQLAAGTKWRGNERMVDAVPPMEAATSIAQRP